MTISSAAPIALGAPAPQLPTSDRTSRRWGLAILVFALGGFVLWSVTADLAVAVVAGGCAWLVLGPYLETQAAWGVLRQQAQQFAEDDRRADAAGAG